MICKNCSVAGDLVSVLRSMDFYPNTVIPIEWNGNYVGIQASAQALANYLHAKCKGATHCDCQHMVDWEGKYSAQKGRESSNEDREPVGETG